MNVPDVPYGPVFPRCHHPMHVTSEHLHRTAGQAGCILIRVAFIVHNVAHSIQYMVHNKNVVAVTVCLADLV